MDFVIPSKSIFTSIGEFVSPPNRAIGQMPRIKQSMPTRPTPIAMGLLNQQLKDGGSTPTAKRASESVPFSTRFALLVFSVRLKSTKSAAGLEALKNDVQSFKAGVKKADVKMAEAKTAELSSVVDVLGRMLWTIEGKLNLKRNPFLAVPVSGRISFRY